MRRILIKRILKVKPDLHFGCDLLNTEKIKCRCDEGECLVSGFISYSILMLVKYSVFCFKLSVIPVAYYIKMKSGGCASLCSLLSLPLCDTGILYTLVLVGAHASCAKPFAVENTLYSRKGRMYEGRSDSDAFTQAV